MWKKIIIAAAMLALGTLVIGAQPVMAGGFSCTVNQSAIPPSECEALRDIYDNTGGPSWDFKTNWFSASVSPCDWFGVDCIAGHVSRLNLQGNNLVGEIPLALTSLPYLEELYMHSNSLTGSIPPELGTLTNLTAIGLGTSYLTGPIPSALGNLTSLTYLELAWADLTGTIPASLGNLVNLERLLLNNNQLVGGLPAGLVNMTALWDLEISGNLLTGMVPAGLASLPLEYFIFSNTDLCEPDNAAYQAWKTTLTSYEGTDHICIQDMFYSLGNYDGWVRESGENTGAGGIVDTGMLVCYVGDDALNRQYRSVLHFNTSRLPDNAVVEQVTLQYKQHSVVGSTPYASLGTLWADIKEGSLSNNPDLVSSDFAIAPSLVKAGSFKFVPSGLAYPLYRATLKYTAYPFINLLGSTQFRLRFNLDDNDDMQADYIKIFCGDMPVPFNRPVLRVWYYLP